MFIARGRNARALRQEGHVKFGYDCFWRMITIT